MVIPSETPTISRPPLLDLQILAFLLVLHVSLACKDFLDHSQNYRVCWRGSYPSPFRVSNKQNIYEMKIKTNIRNLWLDKLD
jgi:hypothetical protein